MIDRNLPYRFLRGQPLKQQRRWRQRKRHLKSEYQLHQTYRAYYVSFNLSNVGKFLWSSIPKDCIEVKKKKTKLVLLCSRPLQNMKLGNFTSYSFSDCKEMYKKAWCTCKVICLINLLLFCHSRCRRRRYCLSSLLFLWRIHQHYFNKLLVLKKFFSCSMSQHQNLHSVK